ncbi:hypothetical protein LIA77_07108 [Sarocladium implicatum]|nr:hypothetical protein LIA77_07108 [Sarocladium implicatum]
MTFFAGPTVHEPGKADHEVSDVDKVAARVPSVPNEQSGQQSLLQRTGSISSWVKTMLPSHRPERGGTARKRGYWEQSDTPDLSVPRARKRFSDSHQSVSSDAGHPDRLTRWNTAKDVSQSDTDAMPPLTRAVSAGHARETSRGSQRQWNWLPQEFRRKARAAEIQEAPGGPETSAALSLDVPVEAISEIDATGRAEQSLMKAQELMDTKKKARCNRRSLKESGDYLGVQGINPDTGELDIITPTDSDGSSITFDKEEKLQALRERLKQAREVTEQTAVQTACEAQEIIRELESESRHSTNREAIKRLHKAVKWRRQTKQWSSAQEPNLSPIAQSRRSTLPASPKSPQPDTPIRITSSPAPLIDLGSPEIMGVALGSTSNSLREIPSRRSSASTVDSRGTVVRTPYRQSLADVSSAALELFDNGISFDRLRGDNKARDEERSRMRGMSRFPKPQTIQDSKDLEHNVERDETRASSPKVSFSERGPGRQVEPISHFSSPDDVSLTHPFVPSPKNISHGYQVTQEDHTTLSSGQDRTGRHPILIQKTIESLKTSSPMSQDVEACPDSESKGRQKWLPQIRQRLAYTEKLQKRGPRAQRQQAQALQSVTNLGSFPTNAITSNLNIRDAYHRGRRSRMLRIWRLVKG